MSSRRRRKNVFALFLLPLEGFSFFSMCSVFTLKQLSLNVTSYLTNMKAAFILSCGSWTESECISQNSHIFAELGYFA